MGNGQCGQIEQVRAVSARPAAAVKSGHVNVQRHSNELAQNRRRTGTGVGGNPQRFRRDIGDDLLVRAVSRPAVRWLSTVE
jgi:hypothetical protein